MPFFLLITRTIWKYALLFTIVFDALYVVYVMGICFVLTCVVLVEMQLHSPLKVLEEILL